MQDIQGETALIKGKILKFLLQYIIKIFLKKAAKLGNQEIVKLLLDAKVNPNTQDLTNSTALIYGSQILKTWKYKNKTK